MSQKRQKASNLQKQFQLNNIQPKSNNQQKAFDGWYKKANNLFLHGTAGTGKTFLALYFAIERFLEDESPIVIIRSVVPSRDIGHLPGDQHDKSAVYEQPYYQLFEELLGRGDAYSIYKQKKYVDFQTSSYLRGVTFRNCTIMVDEVQNCTDQELHTIMTRVGENCRIIFCGDTKQDDLTHFKKQFSGMRKFLNIISRLNQFSVVQFGIDDIQRSDLVRDYIIEREKQENDAN